MVFPHNIAPYEVIIIGLNTDKSEVVDTAKELYKNLQDMGVETLYDDRQETAGVKLNDADLIGIPLRVVVSNRNLSKGCIEVKTRTDEEAEMITLSDACEKIKGILEKIN